MKKLMWLLNAMLLLSLASSSYALDPILIGNFENPAVGGRYDNWYGDGTFTQSTTGATLDNKALKWVDSDGGWGAALVKPFNEYGDTLETNPYYPLLLNPGCVIVVDITAISGEVTDFASLELFGNMDGWWNPFPNTSQSIIIDGTPHTYIYPITDEARTAIENAIGQYNNLGWLMSTGSGSTTIYLDNIWIYPDGLINIYLPHEPSVDDEENGDTELATFHWKAAADPNTDRGLPVDPNIIDQYVFVNNGGDTDLVYKGQTGDPGTEPNSQFGPISLNYNTSYKWAVVEAMAGYTQTLNSSSTLADVDPNNLIGPTWTYVSISTLPEITTQPVNKRAPLGATNVTAFTIAVESLSDPNYQWYNSTDNVKGNVDDFALTSASAKTNTLMLGVSPSSIGMAHQKYYYCEVSNLATDSGGGSLPDVTSNVVTFVVERKVAEYLFEGNLDDTNPVTTDRHNGTGVNGATWAAGDSIEGTRALSLNGTNQYVTLDTAAYPKAVLTGAGGIGGGLDIGSILCWVKATQNGAILANADPNTEAVLQAVGGGTSMLVRGSAQVGYASNPYYIIVNDGNWHLLAATWDMDGVMRLRVDTELVQVDANTATFQPWWYNVLIGAGRPNPDNYTVVGDFFGGLIDNLRVYNYVVDPNDIAQEYYNQTGIRTCVNPGFDGSNFNVVDTGTSYCKVDLADFAEFALSWLKEGFFPL